MLGGRSPAPRAQMPRSAARSTPRSDLEAADSGAVQHNLYVKVCPKGDPDARSREFTLQVLKYIHGRLSLFAKMGLQIKVHKITTHDLQNPRLRAAMGKKGITRLPAMTTPTHLYLGVAQIIDVYERNIKEYTAVQRREDRKVEGLAREDDLDAFYRDEMSFERAEDDEKEASIGESDDMMSAYQSMIKRRDESSMKRRPPRPSEGRIEREAGGGRGSGGSSGASSRGGSGRAAAPGQSSRPDNVGGPRRGQPAPVSASSGDGDDEIQSLISQMAKDIDEGTVTAAFQGGGGDSLEGGGDADSAQDVFMERAFWANQESST
jgi:hypothetical protein